MSGCSEFRFLTVQSLPFDATATGSTPEAQCALYYEHGLTVRPGDCRIIQTQAQRQSKDFMSRRDALQCDIMTQADVACNEMTRRLQDRPRNTRLYLGVASAVLAAAATARSARSSDDDRDMAMMMEPNSNIDNSADDTADLAVLAASAAMFVSVDQLLRESYPDDPQSIIQGNEYAKAQAEFRIANSRTDDLNEYSVEDAVGGRDRVPPALLDCKWARWRIATVTGGVSVGAGTTRNTRTARRAAIDDQLVAGSECFRACDRISTSARQSALSGGTDPPSRISRAQ